MGSVRTTRIAALSAVLVLSAASNAAAATSYVSPTGSGSACTSAAPCSLSTGVSSAVPGTEVVVGSGDYGSEAAPMGSTLSFPTPGITLRGPVGGPRPRLFFDATFGISATGSGSRVADLEIRNASNATGSTIVISGTVERVVARKAGAFGEAVRLMNGGVGTVRDSIVSGGRAAVLVSGPAAFGGVQAVLENVTAVATGASSYGIEVESSSGRPTFASVRGSILRGVAGPAHIVQATDAAQLDLGDSFADPAAVVNSGGGFVDAGGNTAMAPIFVDAAGGDYHQAAASPTIDFSTTSSGSGLDVDGDPRLLGTARDAGGDEFRPAAAATTGDATAVTVSTATVAGTADTGGLEGTWRIEYGPTTAYGVTTPARSLAAARGAQGVAAALEGLPANADVHYRLVVTTSGGTTAGGDRVLRTATPAATPTPTPTPTAVAGVAKVTKLKVSKGRVRFTLSAAARVKIVVKRGTRTVKTITRSLKAGNRSVRLPKLRKGSYRISVEPSRVGTTVKGSFKVT